MLESGFYVIYCAEAGSRGCVQAQYDNKNVLIQTSLVPNEKDNIVADVDSTDCVVFYIKKCASNSYEIITYTDHLYNQNAINYIATDLDGGLVFRSNSSEYSKFDFEYSNGIYKIKGIISNKYMSYKASSSLFGSNESGYDFQLYKLYEYESNEPTPFDTEASLRLNYYTFSVGFKWEMVTDINELNVNDVVTFAAGSASSKYVMLKKYNVTNIDTQQVTVSSNSFIANDAMQFKVEKSGEKYQFHTINRFNSDVDANGYLDAKVMESSGIKINESNTGDGTKFDIRKGNDNNFALIATGTQNKKLIYHDDKSGFISTIFKETLEPQIYIFKKVQLTEYCIDTTDDEPQVNDISLLFRCILPKSYKDSYSKLDSNTTYGIKYKIGSDEYADVVLEPVFVTDRDGHTECDKDEAEYMQYSISIDGIPSDNFNTVITAYAYVKINGKEFALTEKAYSVNTICSAYLAKASELGLSEGQKAMLTYFSTYVG